MNYYCVSPMFDYMTNVKQINKPTMFLLKLSWELFSSVFFVLKIEVYTCLGSSVVLFFASLLYGQNTVSKLNRLCGLLGWLSLLNSSVGSQGSIVDWVKQKTLKLIFEDVPPSEEV